MTVVTPISTRFPEIILITTKSDKLYRIFIFEANDEICFNRAHRLLLAIIWLFSRTPESPDSLFYPKFFAQNLRFDQFCRNYE